MSFAVKTIRQVPHERGTAGPACVAGWRLAPPGIRPLRARGGNRPRVRQPHAVMAQHPHNREVFTEEDLEQLVARLQQEVDRLVEDLRAARQQDRQVAVAVAGAAVGGLQEAREILTDQLRVRFIQQAQAAADARAANRQQNTRPGPPGRNANA